MDKKEPNSIGKQHGVIMYAENISEKEVSVENEILTTSTYKRSILPPERYKHRSAIGVRVEIMLQSYWKREPSKLVKAGILLQWMKALERFSLAEIDKVCTEWVLEKPSVKPNEGHILDAIAKAKVSDMDTVQFWAESIKEGRYIHPNSMTAGLIREMLHRKLVTEADLKARGVRY